MYSSIFAWADIGLFHEHKQFKKIRTIFFLVVDQNKFFSSQEKQKTLNYSPKKCCFADILEDSCFDKSTHSPKSAKI